MIFKALNIQRRNQEIVEKKNVSRRKKSCHQFGKRAMNDDLYGVIFSQVDRLFIKLNSHTDECVGRNSLL